MSIKRREITSKEKDIDCNDSKDTKNIAGKSESNIDNLLFYHQIPDWYQDNEFILTGYRPVSKSYNTSVKSIFSCHNETFNIWSHLLFSGPSFLIGCYYLKMFVGNILNLYGESDSSVLKRYTPIAMSFFYLSACSMFFCSSIFHSFMNHSKKMNPKLLCCDYSGIIIMINGGVVTYLYLTFGALLCYKKLAIFYISSNLILSSLGIFVMTNEKYYAPAYRGFRATIFNILGFSVLLPLIHLIIDQMYLTGSKNEDGKLLGFYEVIKMFRLDYLIYQGFLYVLGVAAFVTRYPEKLYRRTFDFIGHSHNILHIFVVLATGVLAIGLEDLKDF